ncbi:protein NONRESPONDING TO OXYLIPINS 2, mitochondrial-like isoform X1 [Lycium barbarum]|uniref:protein NONRESPONDING TO OXYLIPINS 2, mitochondrial-like isoform X1 n=1 Tax=Lycium barbarum TaxID=112863 RepID=UPI00293E377D|nr:protein NONRESPONDING TO OXYLIPINS 2, mitochondrial-like isoform X1 [Lycium barbarum]
MARRCISFSRTLLSNSRPSTVSSSPSLQSLLGQRPQSRRSLSTILTRSNGVLGCAQSLLPLHSAVAASRLTAQIQMEARTCCQLSQVCFFSHLVFTSSAGLGGGW